MRNFLILFKQNIRSVCNEAVKIKSEKLDLSDKTYDLNGNDINASNLNHLPEKKIKLEKFAYKNENKLSSNLKREPLKHKIVEAEVKAKKNKTVPSEENESPLKKAKWQPENWLEQYKRIKEMRTDMNAPVDTMGCDAISTIDPKLDEKVKRYHVLVSLMLSAQTKDPVTAKAMAELQKMPLTIDNFLNAEDEDLQKMIYPVSFYKRKVQFIKRTSLILKNEYEGDIPDNVQDLIKLPGVGPKMGYITMSCAWHSTVGIGVDTHVHRIANRLGWTTKTTKTPEQTRKELEDWLPSSYWTEVNPMLVGFGQQICRPVGPRCGECLCKDICPIGKTQKEKQPLKKKVKKVSKNESIS